MSLEAEIVRMIRQYPSIFPDRTSCLNQLFCTIGNGYDWHEGELRNAFPDDFEYTTDEALIAYHTKREEEWKAKAEESLSFFELFEEEERIRFERHLAIALDAESLATTEGCLHPDRVYPLCKYSYVLAVPDNVTDEYLLGIVEALNYVRRCGIGPRSPKNIETATRAKKKLIKKFGDRIPEGVWSPMWEEEPMEVTEPIPNPFREDMKKRLQERMKKRLNLTELPPELSAEERKALLTDLGIL